MNDKRTTLALAVIVAAVLVFPNFALAADPPLAPVFSEEFATSPVALKTTFSGSGVWGPARGAATCVNGAMAMKPNAARGASVAYTDVPAITALPARVKFRVRYPQAASYRVARVQLFSAAPYSTAGAPTSAAKLVDWNLGTTSYSTLAWPLQLRASYLGRLDGPYRDPSPVIAPDQWLEGELYIASDTVTGTFNGQVLSARHDIAAQASKGLYLALATTDDNRPAGVELDFVRVEQAAAAPNVAPIAAMTSPSEKTVGEALSFDGSGSSDPDGYIARYAWDFGDGTSATGPQASHTYAGAGTYRVTLTVTDDDGASATTGTTITVLSAAPTALIIAPADAPVRSQVTFDGSGSSDSDGRIITWAWDFGDGTTGSGARGLHAFASPGTYTVTLTVTDDAGLTATTSTAIDIVAIPPTARIVAAESQLVRLPIDFDGATSSDPDGVITDWVWDFGDGATAAGPRASHAYSEPGTYTVTLSVVDNDGAKATTTASVVIESPGAGIDRLIAQVNASSLNFGQKQKLLVELNAAKQAADAGKPVAAAREMRKFISKLIPDKKVDEASKSAWTLQAIAVVKAMALDALVVPGRTPGLRSHKTR